MTILSANLEAFLRSCRAQRLKPATLDWYTWLLDEYARYVETTNLSWDTPETVDAFLAHHATGDISTHTVHAYYRALRVFFNWLEKRGVIESNPIRVVASPRLPRRIPRGIEPAAVTQILGALDASTWFGKRDQAIILFLWDTGVRASELCGLEVHDLDLERRRILIRNGKGGKDRFVPFAHRAQEALEEWLSVRKRNGKNFPHVFLNRCGDPLTRRGLTALLERRSRKAEVEGPYNPHAFRHGFAVAYLDNGGKIHNLQRLMGHATLRSTEVYLWASDRKVQADHAHASPADHLQ